PSHFPPRGNSRGFFLLSWSGACTARHRPHKRLIGAYRWRAQSRRQETVACVEADGSLFSTSAPRKPPALGQTGPRFPVLDEFDGCTLWRYTSFTGNGAKKNGPARMPYKPPQGHQKERGGNGSRERIRRRREPSLGTKR